MYTSAACWRPLDQHADSKASSSAMSLGACSALWSTWTLMSAGQHLTSHELGR